MRSSWTKNKSKLVPRTTLPAALALVVLAGCQQASPTEPIGVAESFGASPAAPAERHLEPALASFSGRVARVDLGSRRMVLSSPVGQRVIVLITDATRFDPRGLGSLEAIARAMGAGRAVYARGTGKQAPGGEITALKVSARVLNPER
jgi:hypothetical protein